MKNALSLGFIALVSFPVCSIAEEAAPVTLNNYADVPTGIDTAIVMDRQGTTLGVVARVERDTGFLAWEFRGTTFSPVSVPMIVSVQLTVSV